MRTAPKSAPSQGSTQGRAAEAPPLYKQLQQDMEMLYKKKAGQALTVEEITAFVFPFNTQHTHREREREKAERVCVVYCLPHF